jgi:hypothetical protein
MTGESTRRSLLNTRMKRDSLEDRSSRSRHLLLARRAPSEPPSGRPRGRAAARRARDAPRPPAPRHVLAARLVGGPAGQSDVAGGAGGAEAPQAHAGSRAASLALQCTARARGLRRAAENWPRLDRFHDAVRRRWDRMLCRWSQRRLTWEPCTALLARFPLPSTRTHPREGSVARVGSPPGGAECGHAARSDPWGRKPHGCAIRPPPIVA